jgi:hypothetical protein
MSQFFMLSSDLQQQTFLLSMAVNERKPQAMPRCKDKFLALAVPLYCRSKAFPQVAETLWGVSQDGGLNGQ